MNTSTTTTSSTNFTAFSTNFTTFNNFPVHPQPSSQYDTGLTVAVVVATVVFVICNSLRQKKTQGLPCWPIIGMSPSLILALRVDLYDRITEILIDLKSTLIFKGPWFSNFNFVVVWDPRNLEHILKTKFSNYPKGPFLRETLHDILGDGIFTTDDEIWRRQKKTASIELFHSSKFRELSISSLVELVHSRLLPYLKRSVESSVSIDLQDLILRLTFDNICTIAFGVDSCSLSADELRETPFAQAFQDATEATSLRFVMPACVWKFMRYFNLGTEKWLKESTMVVDEFVNQVIKQRKTELCSTDHKSNNTTKKSDFLSVFMGLKDVDAKPFSNKYIRDMCVSIIIAGRDTSSVSICWFFWLLEQNSRVEDRIMEEISKIVNERKDLDTKKSENNNDMIFNERDMKNMVYLHAAITESLRLYPALPLNYKEARDDDVFPDGTIIKKGTKVIYSIYSMGRMEAIWGKDCLEFKPERWLNGGHFTSESSFKFSAFNGGPRVCLGKDYSYYQMKFIIASILHRYSVKVVKNHPVVRKIAMTLYMKHGFKVNLYERD